MKLDEKSITTRSVTQWRGLHLLNFRMSSCSQKVRIFMNMKGLKYTSHSIDIAKQEHTSSWFLGINPRGVVPVLIDNGDVHIESNDILQHLDTLPSKHPSLFPSQTKNLALTQQSLALEDSLHLHLRNLTLGFIFPKNLTKKSKKILENYRDKGKTDTNRQKEVLWWEDFAAHGVTEKAAIESYGAFHKAFSQLDDQLRSQKWLLGNEISALDIAWYISTHRLSIAGYPIEQHTHLLRWYRNLHQKQQFRNEVSAGFFMDRLLIPLYRASRRMRGSSLPQIINKGHQST